MKKGLAVILIVCLVAGAITIAGIIGYTKFKDKLIFTAKTTQQSHPQKSLDIAPCDVNTDGKCNVADLDLLNKALGTYRGQKDYIPLADLDADGVVTDTDKQILLKLLDQNPTDETENWKTYTKDKFSIKLPPSFIETIDEYVNSPERRRRHYFFSSPNFRSNKYDGECPIVNKNSLGISIRVNNLALSLNTLDKIREFMRPKYYTYNEEEITLDGQPGSRFLVEFNQCGYKDVLGINDDIYTINKSGIPFTIEGTYFKGDEENKHIFNQILSTFRFE